MRVLLVATVGVTWLNMIVADSTIPIVPISFTGLCLLIGLLLVFFGIIGGGKVWVLQTPQLSASQRVLVSVLGAVVSLGSLYALSRSVPASGESPAPMPSKQYLFKLCGSQRDTWGKKTCGSTTVVFQPIYSGNDSAIITTNVGSRPIWIEITPICDKAPQCNKPWEHRVDAVANPADGSQNQNLTINQPGITTFDWVALGQIASQ
jgi:hypothetical protein